MSDVKSDVKSVEVKQLQQWLASQEAILIDVREAKEFNEWRIPQATFMPLSRLDEQLSYLANEQRKIVFQCLKGKRGETAAQKAMQQYPNAEIYNLIGGVEAWEKAELPLIRNQADIS